MTLDEKIALVKNDILTRFPGCSHTVCINLWDDGTDSVECRHGKEETIYISRYYNNELIFEEVESDGQVMIIDKEGNDKLYYLTDKKEHASFEPWED